MSLHLKAEMFESSTKHCKIV